MTAFGSLAMNHTLVPSDVGAGSSWTFKGAYAAATTYAAGDVVSAGGFNYVSNAAQTGVHP